MRLTFMLVPLTGLLVSVPQAMAQERIARPLTESIAREAARLGTESGLEAQGGPGSAAQSNSNRPAAETLPTGTSIRVTVAPVVEVPGLIRITYPVSPQDVKPGAERRILASDEGSVTLRGPDGGSITVRQPGSQVIGRFEGWDGQILTVVRDDGSVMMIPRGAIAVLEQFRGQSSRAQLAGVGFLKGAGLGAVVFVAKSIPEHWCFGPSCGPPSHRNALFIVAGGAIGALAGALGPVDQWTKVDVSALDK